MYSQNDIDILTAKNSLLAVRKANPKLLVRIWLKYVANSISKMRLLREI